MREIDDLRAIAKGEKVSKESIKHIKECSETWEKNREKVGLNVLTQKDRIIQLEINIAKIIRDLKEDHTNIKTIFILFFIQIFIDGLLLLAMIKVK